MARRGLTPILILVAIVPPRVCTCDHGHQWEAAAVGCVVGDLPGHRHEPDHDDSDCPCLKPLQLPTATVVAAVPAPSPPALHVTLALLDEAGRLGDIPAPVTGRSGEPPPLYLTNCALRC